MKNFKKIYIEITNTCNLNCTFCPKTDREIKFMNQNFFKMVLSKIKPYGNNLYFHIMGEPLLHKDLGILLDICHEENFKVNLVTNGTLIKKAGKNLINKPALKQISFSLHSFDANDTIHFDAYLEDIFQFINETRAESFIKILRLWNLSELNDHEKNIPVLNKIEQEYSIDRLIDKLSATSVKLYENVYLHKAYTFSWPNSNIEDLGTDGFCHGLRNQIGILADGTVVPCCLDNNGTINLGDISQGLSAILESPRAKNLIEGFNGRKAVESLCKKCGYRTKFN